MDKLNRRKLLKKSMLAAGGLALTGAACNTNEQKKTPREEIVSGIPLTQRIKLAISTYSYWHFREPKTTVQTVIEKAAALGVEGVDILHRQMDSEENSYLQMLKRKAFTLGIDLICLSIHQDFVDPDPAVRQKNIDHTLHCIELAYKMGIPCIRLNSGRWNTIKSFDDLMAQRGEEPVLEGYTEEDGFNWCIDSIQKCLPKAEECGVMLALENHWGLTRTPEGLLRIVNEINSPWLGLLMDTGNFLEDPYTKLEKIVKKANFIQAKTYYGEGEWYTLDLDYQRIANMLKSANYSGYISLEFEGKEAPDSGVKKSIELFREVFS
ncbi:sugar phosphate isomerase/epimerase family protein [Rapidithrix thailandica]|uniref:Sugar phosphate isomerase/epimerase family protein n=1 Tax=Rapidithrix thailandica TaxID=413964 RepID=A0AAW9RY42_9BACT